VSLHGEGNVEIALAKHLDPAALLHKPSLAKLIRRDRRSGIEARETLNVDNGELDPVRIPESFELGYATFVPRPAVLPRRPPSPRPTRILRFFEPLAGLR